MNSRIFFPLAVLLGLIAGFLDQPLIFQIAEGISGIFVNLLKLVSLPIIFLSIVSTASGMENLGEVKILGRKVFKYTLLTTLLASTVALLVFLIVDPVQTSLPLNTEASSNEVNGTGYFGYLLKAIPSNLIEPFLQNNVLGVLLIALALSAAALSLPASSRITLHTFFHALYAVFMKITSWIVALMPLAVFGFVCLFMKDLKEGLQIKTVALFLAAVVASNLIQGVIVLPLLLWFKKIPVFKAFSGMFPALSVGFFSKSSSASLPMAISCAENRLNVSSKIARFTFPLCTTINMNGCAAFILTCVFFISMSYGITYSPLEMIAWIFIATIAAIGNAGVPMGCFFLASAFIAAMNLPLHLMGVILPFYAFIDMLETAINVWSDSCVALIVDKEMQEQPEEALLSINPTSC